MAFDNAPFPFDVAALRSKSNWATTVNPTSGGAESRNSLWPDARRKYVLKTTNMTLADWNTLQKHHNGRRGRLRGFPLLDHVRSKALTEPFGTGDGSTQTFQLTIQQGDSSNAYNREIYKPKSGTVLIYDNASLKTETTEYTIDYTSGIVSFVSAPTAGHILTWSGTYYVPVRYDVDELAPSLIIWNSNRQIVQGPEIPLVEIRDTFTSFLSLPLPSVPVISSRQGSVILSSSNTSHATGFDIFRRLSTDSLFSYLASTSVSSGGALSYTDTTGAIGLTYVYRVRATNASGNSGWSNEVSETATLSLASAPGLIRRYDMQAQSYSDGGAVTTVVDSSATGDTATAHNMTFHTARVGAKSTIVPTGHGDITFTRLSTGRSYYAVVKQTINLDNGVLFGDRPISDGAAPFAGNTGKLLIVHPGSSNDVYNGEWRVNGYPDGIDPNGNLNILKPPSEFQIMSCVTTANTITSAVGNDRDFFYAQYEIAEVLICDQAHDSTTQLAVIDLLKAKYPAIVNANPLRSEYICVGDSQTATTGFPVQLIRALNGAGEGGTPLTDTAHFYYQLAISGLKLADMHNPGGYVDQAVARLNTHRRNQIIVLWGGTNDIFFSSASGSDAQAYTDLMALVGGWKAGGFTAAQIRVCTCLPRNSMGTPAWYEADRLAFNTRIRNGAAGNYTVVDLAADSNLDPANTDYIGDGTHVTNTKGAYEAASLVAATITP